MDWKIQSLPVIFDQDGEDLNILSAAGKYGFTALKSEAEAWHAKFLNLTVDNVIDYLLHADANALLLAKKAAMDFILENSEKVVNSETYQHLERSPTLMSEVVKAMSKDISSSRKRKRGPEFFP